MYVGIRNVSSILDGKCEEKKSLGRPGGKIILYWMGLKMGWAPNQPLQSKYFLIFCASPFT
jgi:hypothetical protein